MQVSVTIKSLLSALARLKVARSARSSLPILQNVLLECRSDGLHMTMTDLDSTVRARVGDANVAVQGAVSTAFAVLLELAQNCPPDNEISLSVDGQMLQLRGPRQTYNLLTLPAEDFPAAPKPIGDPRLAFTADLTRAIKVGRRFVHKGDPALGGICFHMPAGDSSALQLAATDAHRMLLWTTDVSMAAHVPAPLSFIVPPKLLAAFLEPGEAIFTFGETAMTVRQDNALLHTPLLDAQYPDVQGIFPQCSRYYTMSSTALRHALSSLRPLDGEHERVHLSFTNDGLDLRCEDTSLGKGHIESLPIDESNATAAADLLQVTLNLDYLLDYIVLLEGAARFEFTHDPTKPVVIRGENEPHVYLCMPMLTATSWEEPYGIEQYATEEVTD